MKYYHSRFTSYLGGSALPLSVYDMMDKEHPALLFHDHDYSEMVIVSSGKALHIAGENSFVVQKGDVLIIHPGVVHAYDNTAGFRLMNVLYDSRKLAIPLLDCWQMPFFANVYPENKAASNEAAVKPVMHLDDDILTQALENCKALSAELHGMRPGNQFGSFTKFMELLLLLARHSSEKRFSSVSREGIYNVIAYINEHCTENITIEKMLKIAKMSRRNFFRLFRVTAGCAPMEFVIRKRLQQAVHYLLASDKSIGELALLCGFYDSNFFCKQFRKEYHITPREFRNSYIRGE